MAQIYKANVGILPKEDKFFINNARFSLSIKIFISELKTEYQLKMDEVEQYSRRNHLIITGTKEQECEDTDRVLLDIFQEKLLNICLDIF